MRDPEQYTIDEMLERLRSRKPERREDEQEGQLVTRPDGTQVIKVRRRKRRSVQPHKQEERKRRRRTVWIACSVTALALLGGLGLLGWVVHLNGGGYRESVAERVERWTGAEVEFSGMRSSPVGVRVNHLHLEWPEHVPAASLRAKGVRGDLVLTSHLSGVWRGEGLVAREGELQLRQAAPVPEDAWRRPEGKLPFRMPLRVLDLGVSFGGGARPALRVEGADASLRVPDPVAAHASIVLEDGRTRLPGLGEFEVPFASLRLDNEGVRVGNVQLRPVDDERAEIRLSGVDLPPLALRGGTSELRVTFSEVQGATLFGEALGELIGGRFETPEQQPGDAACYIDLTRPDALRLLLAVRSSLSTTTTLRGFPFLSALSQELDSPRLARPRFETEARMILRREAGELRLDEILFVSEGLMRVEGELGVARDGTLDGLLEVGLPVSTVLGAPSRVIGSVFDREEGGYRWTTVRIEGDVDAPRDDLQARFAGGAGASVESGESGAPAPRGVEELREAFRELTTPPTGGR